MKNQDRIQKEKESIKKAKEAYKRYPFGGLLRKFAAEAARETVRKHQNNIKKLSDDDN